ncbi:hypothetical protein [Candidatus Marithrix sp. Canyon 246]|nr:hypothetical protein [Candidatus Marithrix sp. Canyon 246]
MLFDIITVYANDPNYNTDTGILDIPAVKIFSEGKLVLKITIEG